MVGRRSIAAVVVALVSAVGVASAAAAHVTAQPPSFPKGATDVLVSFAVPNESTTATTVGVELDLPGDHPMLGVKARRIPGWTVDVVTSKLPKPVTTDDGEVTDAVSRVTWTAQPGEGLSGDEFELFTLLVGTMPKDTGSLTVKALQQYSDGTTVAWIEPVVKGVPAPDHPAPVIKLTGKAPKASK